MVAAISFACPVPIRGAVRHLPRYLPSHRRPFLSRYRLRCPVFIEPCLLKSQGGQFDHLEPIAALFAAIRWIVDRKTISGKKNYQFGRNFFHVPSEPRENPCRTGSKKPPEGGWWGCGDGF